MVVPPDWEPKTRRFPCFPRPRNIWKNRDSRKGESGTPPLAEGRASHDRPPRGQRAAGHPSRGDDPPRTDARRRSARLRLVRLPADRDAAHRAHGSPDRQRGRLRRGPPPDLRRDQQRRYARRAGPTVRPDRPPGPVRRQARQRARRPLQALRDRLGLPRRTPREGALPRVRPVRLRHRRHRESTGRRRDGAGHLTPRSRRRACPRSRSR